MAQFMNGPDSFIHPVTHEHVGPYQWYEANAHVEHEGLHDKKSLNALAKAEKEAAGTVEEVGKEPTPEEILTKEIEAAEEIRKGYKKGGK